MKDTKVYLPAKVKGNVMKAVMAEHLSKIYGQGKKAVDGMGVSKDSAMSES